MPSIVGHGRRRFKSHGRAGVCDFFGPWREHGVPAPRRNWIGHGLDVYSGRTVRDHGSRTSTQEPAERQGIMTTPASTEKTDVGSYFISNYPPYGVWKQELAAESEAATLRSPAPGVPLGLYLHIPFCRKRCKFCYFRVYTDKNSKQVERYLAALNREIELYSQRPVLAGADVRLSLDRLPPTSQGLRPGGRSRRPAESIGLGARTRAPCRRLGPGRPPRDQRLRRPPTGHVCRHRAGDPHRGLRQ